MLENLGGLDSVYFAINFSHEGNRNVWHEIQDVDCCPSTLSVEISGIGPLMGGRRLEQD